MWTSSKRRKLEEEGVISKGDHEVPSSIIVKDKGEEGIDQAELEKAMLEHYKGAYKDCKCVVAMIVYRMNVWRKEEEEKPEGNKDPETRTLSSSRNILDKWEGKRNFGVMIEPTKNGGWYGNPYNLYGLAKPVENCPTEEGAKKSPSYTGFTTPKLHCSIRGPRYLDDFVYMQVYDDDEDGTFVNGEKIPEGDKRMLVDGDVIGLGAPHDSPENWGEDKAKRGLVFKVMSVHKCREPENFEDEDSPSPRFMALNNAVVVNKILSFLSYKELETVRIVNKFWKREIDPKIFRRTMVDLSDICGGFGSPQEFPFKMSMIQQYKIPNWRISVKGRVGMGRNQQGYNDVQQLLKDSGDLIRHLDFEGLVILKNDTRYWNDVGLLNTPNVEELRIGLVNCGNVEYEDSINHMPTVSSDTLFTPTFPSVKYLNLYDVGTASYFPHYIRRFFRKASTLFPNVQGISCTLGGGPWNGKMAKCIADHNLWSNTLKELSCEKYKWIHDDSKEMLYMTQAVSKFSQNLSRLTLHHIEIRIFAKPEAEILSFENMLRMHAGTLEHLELSFSGNGFSPSEERRVENRGLKFPAFPKLKTLEFLVEHKGCNVIFPSGQLSYEKDLPIISTLRIADGGYFFKNENMLPHFIPEVSETVSRTMRRVEFFVEEEKLIKEPGWCKNFAKTFQRMFPNVYHPLIENVDLSMVQEIEECESSEAESGPPEEKDEVVE